VVKAHERLLLLSEKAGQKRQQTRRNSGADGHSPDERDNAKPVRRGTAAFLAEAGLEVETINKVYEGRPSVMDRLKDGGVDLVFNTTEGIEAIKDSREIRTYSLMQKIPYYTTAAAAYAAARAIRNMAEGEIEVKPLQVFAAQ